MKRMARFLVLLVCVLSILCFRGFAAEADMQMQIYGLHLSREGDATLIHSDGHWLLVDTGLAESSDELLQKLSDYGVETLDVLISHLHADHTGGFTAIAESDIQINRLYLPDADLTLYDENTAYKRNRLINAAQSNNPDVTVTDLEKKDTFSFGDVSAEVLGPVADITPADFTDTESQTAVEQYVNCRSLTVRFDCGGISYLCAGDIEQAEEAALVENYQGTDALNADLMKLSHHALPNSNTEAFLAAVSPRYSFAQNSNKTIAEGSNYRLYYNSCKNASQYGPVYLVGDEQQDFRAEIQNGKISIFKGNEKLQGLVTLAGGDGTVVKTNKYYITEETVSEGVYTIGGKKYHIFNGGLVNSAFYSHNLEKYIYRYEPIEGGDVRYVDLEGVLYTGFCKVGDYYRYFDPNTGIMKKGDADYTPVTIDKKKYAINENGVVYNYGASSGAWKAYGEDYRYFGADGVMKTGWLTVGGKKYHLDTTTGLRAVGLKKIDGKTYYFVETNRAGYAWCSGWKKFGDNYRYFGTDGAMKTGWQTIDGKKYYLSKTTGLRKTGFVKSSGKYYYVKSGKKSTATGFVKVDGAYYQIKKGVRVTSAPYEKCGSVYLRLSKTEYTYNGKARKPSVKIYKSNGKELSAKYYKVTYASGRKNVGKYKVTVKLKGKYSGSEKLYFQINPAGTELKSVSAATKSLKVTIQKRTKQVTGYQLQYSTSKSFETSEKKTIKSDKTTKVTIKQLQAKKTYYVRVRTYTTVDGKKYYSGWSDFIAKKTK